MEIKIKSPRGVKLLTEQKYCIENIDVVPELQNKTVTPSDAQQVVTPDAEFAGLGSVTVEPGTVTADATATADDIRLGKTAYGASGKMTGTIADYDGSSEPTSGKSLFAKLIDRSIKEVTLEDLDGITRIGSGAFRDSNQLVSIQIPDSVMNIGEDAFRMCSALTSITIPRGVKSIARATFHNCVKLISIVIPNSITSIENNAFDSCNKLTGIAIPDKVTSIGSNTFVNCHSLTSITIPDSVTNIGSSAFDHCSSLTSISIGKGMTSIGYYIFRDCVNLMNIMISGNVTNINHYAFNSCSTSTELGGTYTILATTPPTIQSDTFQDAKINKIIVPVGTSAAYKAATNWSALADKIVEATE